VKIFSTAIRATLAMIGTAFALVLGALGINASITEAIAAPRMFYAAQCFGPSDANRARYIAIRDRMYGARGLGRHDIARSLELLLADIPLELRWADGFGNLVVTGGKNDLLTNYFKGSSYTAAFYVGLVDNASFSAIAAGDTMASHSGWIESTAYSNANRPTLTLGTASAGSIDNSAAKASFSINATATINGAFCTTNNTKGGTSGTLYSAGSFGSTRSVINGDTLNVQVTLTV